MSTQQPTPGPWVVVAGLQVWAGERLICSTEYGHRYDSDVANAKLIANAPTMLNALRDIVRVYGPESGAGRVALAAIRKATGVQDEPR